MKKKAVKLAAFLLAALVIFLGLSEASKDISRTCISSIKGFYTEPEDSLDVVLIGASEVYAGYSPTEAWKKYGYTSYDFATSGVPGNLYKSMLKEVLSEQDPKVVVFEINGFIYNEKYFTNSGNLHRYIDNMKISKNWAETIREVIPKEEQKYYFSPISTYHDNWKNPKGAIKSVAAQTLIRLNNRSNLKGVATFSKFRNPEEKLKTDNGIMLTDTGRKYLEELCQTCVDEGVENVLFVRFPHLREVGNKDVFPQIEKIVNSYGYDFLNLTDYESLGLDRDHDFYNKDHMNYYGMKKFTAYFSDYLVTHYDLPSEHDEKVEEKWASCTQKADEIFAQCEEDFEKGDTRHYMETSCYFKPELRNNKKE